MNPRIKEVYPLENYKVLTIFQNGEKKIFDVEKYLEMEFFQELKDISRFSQVSVSFGTINLPMYRIFVRIVFIWKVRLLINIYDELGSVALVINDCVKVVKSNQNKAI